MGPLTDYLARLQVAAGDVLGGLTGPAAKREAEASRRAAEEQQRLLDERQAQQWRDQAECERAEQELRPKNRDFVQARRSENELGPAERFVPDQFDRMRQQHEHPPELQKPDRVDVASTMKYSRNPQAAPTLGGTGTKWVNPNVQPTAAQREQQKAADRTQVDTKLDAESTRLDGLDRAAAYRKMLKPEERARLDLLVDLQRLDNMPKPQDGRSRRYGQY